MHCVIEQDTLFALFKLTQLNNELHIGASLSLVHVLELLDQSREIAFCFYYVTIVLFQSFIYTF